MSITFKILEADQTSEVISMIYKLNEGKVSVLELKSRYAEMLKQHYECAGVFVNESLVGICGLWYCTRHYAGKSVELDHVFIDESYRNQGLGKSFLKWITSHVKTKGCLSVELNTYVQNYASHKFYYNEGFEILGYHFLKRL